MEAVIFIGLQASGKSTFFKERFQDTHIRLNLDMLRTRNRENILLNACLEAKQSIVIDNTNPTAAERRRYIELAKRSGFAVSGYYFPVKMEVCLERNARRAGRKQVPELAIKSIAKKLERPGPDEGFDALFWDFRKMAKQVFTQKIEHYCGNNDIRVPGTEYRREKYSELQGIAATHGIALGLCACKNPDVADACCHPRPHNSECATIFLPRVIPVWIRF